MHAVRGREDPLRVDQGPSAEGLLGGPPLEHERGLPRELPNLGHAAAHNAGRGLRATTFWSGNFVQGELKRVLAHYLPQGVWWPLGTTSAGWVSSAA